MLVLPGDFLEAFDILFSSQIEFLHSSRKKSLEVRKHDVIQGGLVRQADIS